MRLTTSVLFLSLATLVGCASDKDSDSQPTTGPGTTGPGTTEPVAPTVTGFVYDCAAGTTCTATATVGGDNPGIVEVEVMETADPAFSCGPDKAVACGVWTEAYNLSGPGYSATLDVVTAAADQVDGSSTLFGTAFIPNITFYIAVQDSTGAVVDCATVGHNTSYYANGGGCHVLQ